jgi:hypothetical protein
MLNTGRKSGNSRFASFVRDLARELVESSPVEERQSAMRKGARQERKVGEKKKRGTYSLLQSTIRMYCFGPRYERYEWLG